MRTQEHHADYHNGHISSDMQTDPVCGMKVNPETVKHTTNYKKEDYYFCAENCLKKFKADPEKYLSPQEQEAVVKGTIYTCPMHAQIRQEGPGSCPICGMALEPEMPSAEETTNHELIDMTRRFWIGVLADIANPVSGDGSACTQFSRCYAANIKLAAIRAGNTCCPVGRMAVLSAGMVLLLPATSICSH
jgi:YHS domain-containing protein